MEVHLEDNNYDDHSDKENNGEARKTTESSSEVGETFIKKRKKRSDVWKDFVAIEKWEKGKKEMQM